jgi:GR25 family glycosyltransferase involved in LPS biosynthesis
MKFANLEFDKAFCINLKRRPERRVQAVEQFKTAGIDVTFIDGLDARALQLKHSGNLHAGMMGCYLTHLTLLQHCLLNNYSRVIIFEDDASFIIGSNALLRLAMPVIPDNWQFAYLGYCVYHTHLQFNKQVNDFWCIPGACWGTQAYMINGRETMEKIYSELQTMKDQIDLQMNAYLRHSTIKFYGITPSCVKQRGGRSDVQ